MWENGVVVLRVLKLPRINTINLNKQKKKKSLYDNSKTKKRKICFFFSLGKQRKKIQFFFLEKQNSFSFKSFIFYVKTNVKTLTMWKKKKKNDSRISSSIQDLRQENWLVKQLVQILEHFRRYNLEILYFHHVVWFKNNCLFLKIKHRFLNFLILFGRCFLETIF